MRLQNKENELQEDFPLLETRKVTQGFSTKSSHLHFSIILVSAYPSPCTYCPVILVIV